MEKMNVRNPYHRVKRPRPGDVHVHHPGDSSLSSHHQSPTTTPIINNKNTDLHDTDNKNDNNSSNRGNVATVTTISPTRSYTMSDLVVSASDKAGMDGIDRAAIDAIIEKESGNSLFMQQQKKRNEKVNQRIAAMKLKMRQLQPPPNQYNNRSVDAEMAECLSVRPLRSCKVVVDMDMFYMACELLTRPDITPATPACVGGKSMITTSNYAARRYGVRAAMPGYIGSALVHQLSNGKEQLIFCPLNFDLYREKSRQVRQVLSEYDANLTAYSLDEAYMDLAPYLYCSLLHSSWTHEEIKSYLNRASHSTASNRDDESARPTSKRTNHNNVSLEDYYHQLQQYSTMECLSRIEMILINMREQVRLVTGGLTCSAGCAPNFLLAKIASDVHKPNGQCIVPSDPESILHFLHPLPIRKISGIGRVTEKILRAFDIVTVQQLYQERATIRYLFDRHPSTSNFLIRASFGCGSNDSISSSSSDNVKDSIGVSSNLQKGISRERTIPSGQTWAEINSKLEDVARLLADDMEKKELAANTIYVKVKLHTFDLLSHGRTLPRGVYIVAASDLIPVAAELLQEIRQQKVDSRKNGRTLVMDDDDDNNNVVRQLFSVRLVGIRCTNFKSQQQSSSDMVMKIGGTQRTMDQFLCRASSLTESHQPVMVTNRPAKIATNVVQNPYDPVSRSPPPPPPKRTSTSVETEKDRGFESVPDPVTTTTASDTTSDRFPHHHSDSTDHRTIENDMDHVGSNSSSSMSGRICCPICHVPLPRHASNDVLNRHIDVCLNGRTVQQMVRQVNVEEQQQQQNRNDRRRNMDFFTRKTN